MDLLVGVNFFSFLILGPRLASPSCFTILSCSKSFLLGTSLYILFTIDQVSSIPCHDFILIFRTSPMNRFLTKDKYILPPLHTALFQTTLVPSSRTFHSSNHVIGFLSVMREYAPCMSRSRVRVRVLETPSVVF
jgi:hypothetical protein